MNSGQLFKKKLILAFFVTGGLILFFWANMQISPDVSTKNNADVVISQKKSHPEALLKDNMKTLISGAEKHINAIPLNVQNRLCAVNLDDNRAHLGNRTDLKMLYFVTPTYPRPTQIPELTRLSHTLMHVPRLHWIVADEQPLCSPEVLSVLGRSGLPFTLISSPKPYLYKTANFPRGVANRRAALDWIRDNIHEGVLYFGDDDNTYDLQLFEEVRRTKGVAMLPVGLIGGYGVSSPVVAHGKVVAFYDSWPSGRTFPVDMAGFAVNIGYLKPTASMPFIVGYEEDKFLTSLGLKVEDIEPLADNCSKVFVWHTKTTKFKKPNLKFDIDKIVDVPKYASFAKLLKETVKLGMASISPYNGTKLQVIKNRKNVDALSGI